MWKLWADPTVRSVPSKLVHPGGANTSSALGGQTTRVAGSTGKFLKVNRRYALVFRHRCTEVTTHPGRKVIGSGVTHVTALARKGGDFFQIVSLQVTVRIVGVL